MDNCIFFFVIKEEILLKGEKEKGQSRRIRHLPQASHEEWITAFKNQDGLH